MFLGCAIPIPIYDTAAPVGSNWNNGYSYRRRIVLPKEAPGENLTNFPLLLRLTDLRLRSIANSGHVQSNAGVDIRLETGGGTKLDYELEFYDPVAGTLIAWVRIPTFSATIDTTVFLYYGNATLVNETNPSGVWQDYLAVWHLGSSATDKTANAHILTPQGTVAVDTTALIGSSVNLTGSGYYSLSGIGWADGLAQFTLQIMTKRA